MTFTRRDRRDWRIILWINIAAAVASACFGYLADPVDVGPWTAAVVGVLTSVLIATPIVYFEVRLRRPGPLRRLKRLPLAVYFGIKVVFYLIVIIAGLLLARLAGSAATGIPFHIDHVFASSIVFAIAMSIFGNMLFEMGGLLGYGTLRNLVTGRYVQPRSEQMAFLLIDMKDSTGIAERLGALRFHELLNLFFSNIADAALECDAEIHKYVGDEAILTWPDDRAVADGECLACPFVVGDLIASNSERYRRRFGIVPEFRAALHRGEIVAGEIGDIRREIAYVGDTLNVAARLLEAAKTTRRDVLVSADLLEQSALPAGLEVEHLPTLTVRGRAAPLAISALRRSAAAG
jgi:adenylate cyclase